MAFSFKKHSSAVSFPEIKNSSKVNRNLPPGFSSNDPIIVDKDVTDLEAFTFGSLSLFSKITNQEWDVQSTASRKFKEQMMLEVEIKNLSMVKGSDFPLLTLYFDITEYKKAEAEKNKSQNFNWKI